MTLMIRKATYEDIPALMEIFSNARGIMHHILGKYGFTRCGVIYLANGDPREAYQKNL